MKITLHTPAHLDDTTSTTEFEANDIIHIESISGRDPDSSGAKFWLKGINESKHCSESVNDLKKLVEENKEKEELLPISIGQIGDQVSQTGFNILFWNPTFVAGFISGIIASLIAAYIYNWIAS